MAEQPDHGSAALTLPERRFATGTTSGFCSLHVRFGAMLLKKAWH
jgi:hypothetical protein